MEPTFLLTIDEQNEVLAKFQNETNTIRERKRDREDVQRDERFILGYMAIWLYGYMAIWHDKKSLMFLVGGLPLSVIFL